MDTLVANLQRDYPQLSLRTESSFYWSATTEQIFYDVRDQTIFGKWSLLHEVGHALLSHNHFQLDLQLLQYELAAWEYAKTLGQRYELAAQEDYIQDCLDSYRDWLHKRATCPTCGTTSIQSDVSPQKYYCFNCHRQWQVGSSRLCRIYRRRISPIKT
jgi:hypothetical protein